MHLPAKPGHGLMRGKMETLIASVAMALGLAGPAWASGHLATGNAAAGESLFRQCVACHVVVNDAGKTLAGRNARTGPHFYGIAGATVGSVDGFRYSDLLLAAKQQGFVFTEDVFVAYVMDPTGATQKMAGEDGRGRMAFRVRSEEDARNLYAYLGSFTLE